MKFTVSYQRFLPFHNTRSVEKSPKYTNILKFDIGVIHHAKKSLMLDSFHTWIKKQGALFDVTMGAYDGAEVCEIVGLTYMLNVLSKTMQQK